MMKLTSCYHTPFFSAEKKSKLEEAALVSHQSFVLKKEIGMFLLWGGCDDTLSVQWDGFHFLDSHGGRVPTQGNLDSS